MPESPSEKFRRLGLARLAKTLHQFKLLANLAGYNYKGTREDKDFIISKLRKALDELEYRYSGDNATSGAFTIAKDEVDPTEFALIEAAIEAESKDELTIVVEENQK